MAKSKMPARRVNGSKPNASKRPPGPAESKKRTHKPAQGARGAKAKMQNPDQQGARANIRQNQRNIDRRTMR